jgi:hypothetical protein
MERLISTMNKNKIDNQNKDYVDAIYDKLIKKNLGTVFDESLIDPNYVCDTGKTGEHQMGINEVPMSEKPDDTIIGPKGLGDKIDSDDLKSGSEVPVSTSTPGHIQKWTYKTKKGADATILWDGDSKECTILAGSTVAREADGFVKLQPAKTMKEDLISKEIVKDNQFVCNYKCDKISTMINVLNGGSVSMPAEIANKHLIPTGDTALSGEEIAIPPRPQLVTVPEPSDIDVEVYKYKGVRIRCDISTNECTILRGSRVQSESPKFATNASGAKKLKDELIERHIIENDFFVEDYSGSLATLLNLVNGGSVSAPREKEKFVKEIH